MISADDHQRVVVRIIVGVRLTREIERHLHCLVQLDDVINRTLGVHTMRLLVDVGTFDHQKKPVGVLLQHVDGFPRAARPADDLHPLGHGRERFLWAFLATIASFLIGGCFSVAIAIRQLARGEMIGNATAAWIVLAVAFLGDGASLVQGVRQARNEAEERAAAASGLTCCVPAIQPYARWWWKTARR